MKTLPSASMRPASPVRSQPSTDHLRAAHPQLSVDERSSVFGIARPTEPGTVPRSRSGPVAPQVVSVRPQPWPTAACGKRRATARWRSALERRTAGDDQLDVRQLGVRRPARA